VIEVQGRIAHIFQWDDNPTTEKVGVMFTRISSESHKVIQQYLDGALQP
jgi:hypothetical protein